MPVVCYRMVDLIVELLVWIWYNCDLVGLGRVCAAMNKNRIVINKNLNLSEEERRGIGGGYRKGGWRGGHSTGPDSPIEGDPGTIMVLGPVTPSTWQPRVIIRRQSFVTCVFSHVKTSYLLLGNHGHRGDHGDYPKNVLFVLNWCHENWNLSCE